MAALQPITLPTPPALAPVSFFERPFRSQLATLGGIALGAYILYVANRAIARHIDSNSRQFKKAMMFSCFAGGIAGLIGLVVLAALNKKPLVELIPSAILPFTSLYQALAVKLEQAERSPRPQVSLDKVANVGGAKKQVENILKIMQAYRPGGGIASAVSFPTAMLFYGPPGTGKTLLSSALVTSVSPDYTVYRHVLASNLVNKYVGTGPNAIRKIFEGVKKELAQVQARLDEARKAGVPGLPFEVRAFIYFEEMDSLMARTEERSNDESIKTVNALLGEIDQAIGSKTPITVMGSTNRREAVDPAILSRIPENYQIHVPPPNERERLDILKVHFKDIPLGDDVSLEQLAKQTAGYVGRGLRDLVQAAINSAAIREANEISAEDISVLGGERAHDKMPQYHEAAQKIVWSEFNQAHPHCPTQSKYYYKAQLRYLLAPIAIEELLVAANRDAPVQGIERTSHVADSLAKATQLAREMVCGWAMADVELPLASIDKIQPVTRDLQYKIEHAVLDLIAKAKDETQELLSSKLDQIKRTVEGSKKLAILLS